MLLYHGSKQIVDTPRFGFGKPYNDYGLGFYCTKSMDMAREWAVGFDRNGFVNSYSLDTSALKTIDLDSSEYCTLHWLTMLLQNRWFDVRSPLANEAREYLIAHFAIDASDADIIEGYRADDSYFTFAQDFIAGSISYRQLNNAMKLGELGRQVMLKSLRAFERLEFLGAEGVQKSIWLPRREQRDRSAREVYLIRQPPARRKGDLFISQIIDEEMGPGDDRLQ